MMLVAALALLLCAAGASAGPAAHPVEITVGKNVTNDHVNKRWMGCHSDCKNKQFRLLLLFYG